LAHFRAGAARTAFPWSRLNNPTPHWESDMTKVYFATNRVDDGTAPFGYGAQVVPFDITKITFAVADVEGIDLTKEDSGTINSITDKTSANFSADARTEIISSEKNLLVFIHGFDNTFEDAIKRAAFNREWFANAGNAAADMTVLAFTWPSAGKLFAAPPHMPPDAYLTDQAQAGKSAFHLAYFLRVIAQLRADYQKTNPRGRVILLAHSMGNFALAAAVQLWFTSNVPDGVVFDEVLLPAADEIWDSFLRPAGGHLSDLPKLGSRISIYNSRKDVTMYLSTTINLSRRLGFDGPEDKTDHASYPLNTFRLIDCTEVNDFNLLDPPDATHQYYRRSKKVRTDIVSVIAGDPGAPLIS